MGHHVDDTNKATSTHAPQVAGKAVTPTDHASGHALEVGGDLSVWDTVSNKYVNISYTDFGTVNFPKNQ